MLIVHSLLIVITLRENLNLATQIIQLQMINIIPKSALLASSTNKINFNTEADFRFANTSEKTTKSSMKKFKMKNRNKPRISKKSAASEIRTCHLAIKSHTHHSLSHGSLIVALR